MLNESEKTISHCSRCGRVLSLETAEEEDQFLFPEEVETPDPMAEPHEAQASSEEEESDLLEDAKFIHNLPRLAGLQVVF